MGTVLLVGAILPFALRAYAGAAARAHNGSGIQLPVGSICGVAWDVEEKVALVALCEFARVQAYDSDGRFRFGWSVPASGGNFHFSRVAEGRYEVEIVRGRRRLLLNAHGKEQLGPGGSSGSSFTPKEPIARGRPRLGKQESVLGDWVALEWSDRTVKVGGSWVAPLIANKLLSFGFGVIGVVLLESWRRKCRANVAPS